MALQEKLSDMINDLTYTDTKDRMMNLALAMFEWTGFPDSVSPRFLEETLATYGRGIFFKDPTMGFMGLRVTPAAEMNVYREWLKYTAWSIGYNETYNRDECVLVRNNYLMTPTERTVELFALRAYEAQRTIDVNIAAQQTPYIVVCSEQGKLTMINAMDQVRKHRPVIYAYKGNFNKGDIDTLPITAPYVADKVQDTLRNVWNQFFLFLGVKPLADQKRERMIQGEVEADVEQVVMGAQVMLLTRKEACEQINKKWGLHVDVKMRKELAMMAMKVADLDLEHKYDEPSKPEKKEEGEQNG